MSTDPYLLLLIYAPVMVQLVFTLGLFFYTWMKPPVSSSARYYALLGLGILAAAPLVEVGYQFLFVRWTPPSSSNAVLAAISVAHLVLTLFKLAALSLLVAAAFTGRSPQTTVSSLPYRSIVDSNNPYQPPSN